MSASDSTKTAPLTAPIPYLIDGDGPAEHRIYPVSSGRAIVRPEQVFRDMPVHDARRLAQPPRLEEAGFELLRDPAPQLDFYDDDAVRRDYYPAVIALLTQTLGASEVIVFDHNQRAAARAAAGQRGVRTPAVAAHVDYTPASGPRRAREILDAAGRAELGDQHLVLVNVWRPIVGPVQDVPLAVCDPRSAESADYVETNIYHFGEDDLERPRHSGQIYSLRHRASHRWYYVPDMHPDEVLLLRNWDSLDTQHLGFAAHTGFRNPAAPTQARPRESIEVRTLVVDPNRAKEL